MDLAGLLASHAGAFVVGATSMRHKERRDVRQREVLVVGAASEKVRDALKPLLHWFRQAPECDADGEQLVAAWRNAADEIATSGPYCRMVAEVRPRSPAWGA